MSPVDAITALEKARQLIAGGWSEPFSLDAEGKLCAPDAEGLTRVCVADALVLSASDVFAAEALLEAQLRARQIQAPLSNWLASPKRTHSEVLRLFERTIAHLRVAA